MMKFYSDGFCLISNPTPVGGGYTVCNEFGDIEDEHYESRPGMTSNEAELRGVLRALEIAGRGDTVSTDSMNTIRWVNSMGKPKKKRARKDLDWAKKQAYVLMTKKQIHLIWEPRHLNLAGHINEEKWGA